MVRRSICTFMYSKWIYSPALNISPSNLTSYKTAASGSCSQRRRRYLLCAAVCRNIPGQQAPDRILLGQVCILCRLHQPGQVSVGFQAVFVAVWIRLNITALPAAPFGILANRKLFRSITKCIMFRSARLLFSSSRPSFR